MISADAAFEKVANAAAAAFAAAPAAVSYRVAVHVDTSPPIDRTMRVLYRVGGEGTVVPDARTGNASAVLPLPPILDALAQWAFHFDVSDGNVRMTVAYQRPKRYVLATPGPGIDVVAVNVNGYRIAYAGSGHILLNPDTAAMREFAAQPDQFTYREVWFDTETLLPTRVVLVSSDETLDLQYVVVAGHWLLGHVTYHGVAREPRASRYEVEASYDDYAFPADGST